MYLVFLQDFFCDDVYFRRASFFPELVTTVPKIRRLETGSADSPVQLFNIVVVASFQFR